MKYITVFILSILINLNSKASTLDTNDCYNRLLKGSNDSVVYQMDVTHITSSEKLKEMTRVGLHKLLQKCNCTSVTIKKISCGEAILGNDLTKICYGEATIGYFIVSKDLLDNLNIIFNRWD